jgi:hypothetical protein
VEEGLPAEWFTSCRWVIPEVIKGAYNYTKKQQQKPFF